MFRRPLNVTSLVESEERKSEEEAEEADLFPRGKATSTSSSSTMHCGKQTKHHDIITHIHIDTHIERHDVGNSHGSPDHCTHNKTTWLQGHKIEEYKAALAGWGEGTTLYCEVRWCIAAQHSVTHLGGHGAEGHSQAVVRQAPLRQVQHADVVLQLPSQSHDKARLPV
jgi:hypothetical protein